MGPSYPLLAAVLGLGIGMIVRHGAAAVAGLLIWGLVIEGLLQMFLPATIWRSSPLLAGDRLLGLESDLVALEAFAVMFSRTLSAAVLASYAAVSVLVGVILLHRRDVA